MSKLEFNDLGSKRLSYEWSDELATGHYVLKVVKVQPLVYMEDYYYSADIASGDLAWAKRTAKHYGIGMPNE